MFAARLVQTKDDDFLTMAEMEEAASAAVKVRFSLLKHGNRSIPNRCGSVLVSEATLTSGKLVRRPISSEWT